MTRTIRAMGVWAVAMAMTAGCTVSKQEAPDLSGPSVLATSITLSATPDTLRQDGASQSTIVFTALDANSKPVKSLPIRVDVAVGGTIVDYGTLSSKNVTTGTDGRASVSYTAPPASADPVDTGTIVDIYATPTGTDYANATWRSVSIRLVPPGVILPPNSTPVPNFTYSPSAPVLKQDVLFDGSLSTDADGYIVNYQWTFGDGSGGNGRTVTHEYTAVGSYTVSLTVTDDRGYSASTTQNVAVANTSAPTASFVFSPAAPTIDDDIVFNASSSTAAAGRTIVSYEWDFGTGRTGSGMTVTKQYGTAATYRVTLVVTDDAGRTGSATKDVPVSGSGMKAAFIFSPTDPAPNTLMTFDASQSTAGSTHTIVSYAWNFGDNRFDSGKLVNHTYTSVGTYAVLLTITDETGRTVTTTQTVSVTLASVLPR
jgi:PKD repeat protein